MTKKIGLATLIAFLLSILCGILIPQFADSISFLGTIYINLLKMIMIPILFFSIINALVNSKTNAGRTTIVTVIIFIIMFVVSFLLCSGLWAIIQPGQNFIFAEVEWDGTTTSVSLGEFLISLFPSNIIEAMSTNSVLPTIIFTFAFGIALSKIKPEGSKTIETINKVMNRILSYIMWITPIGVFALMYNTTANYGVSVLGTAGLYIAMAYIGCALIAILVMILPPWIIAKVSPITYIKRVYKIWIITLSTCSSAATLPNTMHVCNEEFKIPESITNLVVPLGCTIHMCGGAVSFSLLSMFNMQMFNIHITLGTFLLMLVVALIINMGAPGIPGGGVVIGATYLSILGVPLTFIGFYAGIYRVLDMAYTTMNVCGDITANILVNHEENRKKQNN